MSILYDNIVVFAVTLVAAAYAWLMGGTDACLITPVMPWLFVILLETMLCFPQRHLGETTYDARARVWYEMRHDPVVWVTLAFFVMLLIPFVNKGLCPSCDYDAIHIGGKSPKPFLPFIPFCVDRLEHLNVVLWFFPALTAMLAVRHSLLKRGKRHVIELIVWNGLALSLIGIVQSVSGAKHPLWADLWMPQTSGRPVEFFSTFGYPNMAGDYFTTLFALAIAVWRWKLESARLARKANDIEHTEKFGFDVALRKHFMLIPAAIFFFSAMMTLSRAAIMLVSLIAVLAVSHAIPTFMKRMHRARRVMVVVVSVPVLAVVILSTYLFMPKQLMSDIQREIHSLDSTAVADRLSSKGQYHGKVAVELLKKYPFFGCGGWGYKHFSVATMIEKVEEPRLRLVEIEAEVAKAKADWEVQKGRARQAKERLSQVDEDSRRAAKYEAEDAERQAKALGEHYQKEEQRFDKVRRETMEGAAGEAYKAWRSDLRHLQTVGGVNVHNDYLQFIVEHGAIGFACLAALVFLLVLPLKKTWRALYNAVRFIPVREQPPVPIGLFALPAPVFFILAGALATFIHGFGDCPFRSPAVLTLFFVMLAAIDGYLPRLKQD